MVWGNVLYEVVLRQQAQEPTASPKQPHDFSSSTWRPGKTHSFLGAFGKVFYLLPILTLEKSLWHLDGEYRSSWTRWFIIFSSESKISTSQTTHVNYWLFLSRLACTFYCLLCVERWASLLLVFWHLHFNPVWVTVNVIYPELTLCGWSGRKTEPPTQMCAMD